MEFYDSIRPGNGATSYLLRWAQEIAASPHATGATAALGGVVSALSGVVTESFFALLLLWVADMLMGTLHAWASPKIDLSWSRTLDGVMRLMVYGILGVVLVLVELLIAESTGADVTGVFLTAGYAVCALAEIRSLVKHFNYFIPGFNGFGARIQNAIQALTREEES